MKGVINTQKINNEAKNKIILNYEKVYGVTKKK
jgi:hypothetical protein